MRFFYNMYNKGGFDNMNIRRRTCELTYSISNLLIEGVQVVTCLMMF